MILSPSIRRTAQRRGVHLSRLDPDANVPTDARRNNGSPAHDADCSCPFCKPCEFPRHLDVRMSEEDYRSLEFASSFRGKPRAAIVRDGLREVLAPTTCLPLDGSPRWLFAPRAQGARLHYVCTPYQKSACVRVRPTHWRVPTLLDLETTPRCRCCLMAMGEEVS